MRPSTEEDIRLNMKENGIKIKKIPAEFAKKPAIRKKYKAVAEIVRCVAAP